jgi:hypothetical protein
MQKEQTINHLDAATLIWQLACFCYKHYVYLQF